MKIHSSALALVALFLSAVTAFATINPALQMLTGNPSAAATDPVVNRTNFLIQRAQYAFGYNDTTREPNWVAWNLTSGDVGTSGRSPDFFQDTNLPAGFYQVLPTDYSGSGYDRGHLCPSGDRTVSRADNDVVFFMSNMMPQAPDNNQGVWASFETYCRTLADAGSEVLIIAGPGGFAGSTIASGVSIPGFTWKIAVVVPLGAGTALSRITATTRVIAIKIPNTAGVRSNPWQQYVTSTTQLQTDTGYTFFTDPALAGVAAALRAQVDGQTATGAPTLTTQPSAQTSAVAGSASFSVTATSNPASTLTYQWLKNDDAITGNASATTATLTLTNVQAASAAIYTAVVTNPIGSVTSAGAALVITGLPPVVATAPASITKTAGTTAVFTVSATGSPTLTYQWRKGGTNLTNTANITGATSATLTVTNVQTADAATYDVVVSNTTLPNATSAGATLTVTAAAPTITLPPATQTAVVGNITTFTVTATGTAPFTYQWRKGSANLANGVTGNGSTIAGATTATLTVTNTQLADAGNFDVVVANGINPDTTSAVAVLTVSAVATPSTVAWNFGAGAGTESAAPTSGLPADVTGGTVTSGNNNGTTTLVTAVSVSNTYSGFSAGNNAGAAARVGALNPAAAGSAFFQFTLTPAANKQLSVSALTFGNRSTGTGPQAYSVFSSADNYTTAIAAGTISANSAWALHSPAFTAVSGTTGTALTFRIYGHSGAGSPGANTANWRIDDLKVTLNTAAGAPLVPAVAATTPVGAATGVAGNAPITVTFNQSVTVATGWFTINSALTGGIAATVTGGPTTYTLTPPVSFTDNDTVTVTIIAAQITDTATSTLKPAANTVLTFTTAAAVAPTIATAPTPETADAGASATFTVVASGTAPFAYQWRKNAVNITGNASATTSTLILPNVQAADASAGPYDVVVTNSVSSITSAAVALTVTPVAPAITTAPVAATVLSGNNTTFTVVATGTTPFTYQWRKGGVALVNGAVTNAATISGATGATLTLTSITSADAGNYDVVVTNSVASAAPTTAVALTVTLPPASTPTNYTGGSYAQNFDGLPSTGTFTFTGNGPYALDVAPPGGVGATSLLGWSFAKYAGTGAAALFKFDNGGSNSGGANSYGTATATDRALGSLGSGGNSSRFGIALVNTTGQTLSTFTLGYTGEQWRHGGALIPNKLAFSYATGAIDINTVVTGGFTAAPALDFTAPIATATTSALDGNLAANRVVIAPVTITGLTWAAGQTLILRWTDVDDAGSDDGLGLDDLTFTAVPVLSGQPVAQTITSGGTATFTVATAATPATYQWRKNGTALAGIASATTATLSLAGATTLSAGSYDCIVTNSAGSATSASATLTVNRISATLTLLNLAATYDGKPKSATVVTNPGGLPLVLSYGGSTTVPSEAGSYVVSAVVNTSEVEGSASGLLTIAPAAQTVTLGALPATVAPGVAFTLNATASSGLPVTLSVVSGNASVAGNSITLAATSPVTLRAAQEGNGNYLPATVAEITLTAGKLAQTITLTSTISAQVSTAGLFTLAATSSSGLPVTWSLVSGPATVSGNTLALTGAAGTVVARAAQAGNVTYNPATATDLSFEVTVAKLAQSIAFTSPLPAQESTAGPLTLSATASSGLPVTFALISGPATLGGNTLTLTGTAGTVVVRASQLGNTAFNAAPSADLSFPVTLAKLAQTIAFTSTIAAQISTAGPFTLGATATSGLPVTFALVSGPATLSGNTLTLTGTTGTVVVRASQAGNTTYNPATPADLSFTVALAPVADVAPRITTQPLAQVAQTGGTASFSVTATGTPAPTYQWRKNGEDLSGATSASLTLANVQSADAAGYDVVLTNVVRSVTSSLARLTVSATATAPVITRQPGNVVALAGRSATFTVVATGAPAPMYQWSQGSAPISGATGSTLSLASVTTADIGNYAVIVTNSAGTVTSSAATLAVIRRSYAGTYFGTLGNGGSFALRINDDNTGVFLGFLPGSSDAFVSRAVTIDDEGRFSFTVNVANRPLSPATSEPARAAVGIVFDGTITGSGSLATSPASTYALAATKSPATGATAASAGFYQAGSSGSSAQTLVIVSPSGQAFVVTQTGTTSDAGTGTIDATGKVTVTTAARTTISANVAADTTALTATVTTAAGTTTTFTGFADNSAALAQQRIVNLSTRTTAGIGDQVAIVGFVITGLESKPVLLRAVGPALRGLGVTTALAAPRLELRANGVLLATNTGWSTTGNAAEIAHAAARSGAFPLAAGSADSVILTTLVPGTYSALMSASDARSGVGLVEIYDLSGGSLAQKLTNLSARAAVGSGEGTLISGLVVGGSAPKRVLIRAAGPSLTQFGVAGALARPALALFSATGIVLAQNTGWSTSADAATIADAAARVGAFAFGATSADSALILNLPPGAYTAQVTGVAGPTGTALLEVYELP